MASSSGLGDMKLKKSIISSCKLKKKKEKKLNLNTLKCSREKGDNVFRIH